MAVISFGTEIDQIWGGAGWAFRQALKDLLPYARDDKSLCTAIEQAAHIGYLGVEGLDPAAQFAMVGAIKRMCTDITSSRAREFPSSRTPEQPSAND